MKLTYYGHSCFAIHTAGKTLLFDPFITPNPLAAAIDVDAINPDYILVSHGHIDHVADAEKIARKSGAMVISNWEIIKYYESKGLTNVHPMNIGGHWMFDFGKVKCVVAVHSSSMPDGSDGGSPMGFLIETDEGNFYYSGDTALTYDMKLIGEYKSIDFALLPIGNNFTMGVDNAIIAASFINCAEIVGLHYDTFPYVKIDKQDAINKFSAAGLTLHLPPIGGVMEFSRINNLVNQKS